MPIMIDPTKDPDTFAALLNSAELLNRLESFKHVTKVQLYSMSYPPYRKRDISEPENEADYLESRFEDMKESLRYMAFYCGKDDSGTNRNFYFILHNYSPIVGINLQIDRGYKDTSPILKMFIEHRFEFGKTFPEIEHIIKGFDRGFEYART